MNSTWDELTGEIIWHEWKEFSHWTIKYRYSILVKTHEILDNEHFFPFIEEISIFYLVLRIQLNCLRNVLSSV